MFIFRILFTLPFLYFLANESNNLSSREIPFKTFGIFLKRTRKKNVIIINTPTPTDLKSLRTFEKPKEQMHRTKYLSKKSISFQSEFDYSYQLFNSNHLSFANKPTRKAQGVFEQRWQIHGHCGTSNLCFRKLQLFYAFQSNTRCAKNVGHRCGFLLKNQTEIRLWVSNFLAVQNKHAIWSSGASIFMFVL